MNYIRNTVIVVFLFGLMSLPAPAKANSHDEAYRQLLLELLSTLQQQLELLLQEQALAIGGDSDATDSEGYLTGSVEVLYEYPISSTKSVRFISNPTHREYFSEVFDILPYQYAKQIKRVVVFEADGSEYDAFVETIAPKHETWSYAVSDDALEEVGTTANLELVIHEIAHIISYEAVVGEPSPSNVDCHSYFKTRGCLPGNTYLDEFVDEFWSATDLNRALSFSRASDQGDAAYDYYEDHQSEYVSDYAAVSPEEDFAESFMFYILDYDSAGSEAMDKIDFFDSFVDLRFIKQEIY